MTPNRAGLQKVRDGTGALLSTRRETGQQLIRPLGALYFPVGVSKRLASEPGVLINLGLNCSSPTAQLGDLGQVS